MNPDDLNQSHGIPHNDRPNPDKAPSFNVYYMLENDAFVSSQMYLIPANNCVTKYPKEIDSTFVRQVEFCDD